MARITVLIGSARKNGNTELLADAFIGGAAEAGHTVIKVTLYNRKIAPCMDCKYCYKNDGRCVINDDMTGLYDILRNTDIIVFATPVYFYNFTAQLKCVLDRLHNPVRSGFRIESSVLLSVCADEGPDTFEPLICTYKAIINYLRWNDRGSILIDGAEEKGSALNHPKLREAELLGRSL